MKLSLCIGWVVALTIYSAHLFAQTPSNAINSLKNELQTTQSATKKIKLYGKITTAYRHKKDSAHTLLYANKMLQLATKHQHWQGIWKAHYEVGSLYEQLSQDSLAVQALLQALYAAEQDPHIKNQADTYNLLGGLYKHQGNISLALLNYKKALALQQKLKNDFGIAANYNNLANVFSRQGNNMLGLEYYQKALSIWQKNGNEKLVALTANNMGLLYIDLKNYVQAATYLSKALEIRKRLQLKKEVANTSNHLGMLYKITKEYTTALRYYQQSLQVYRELNNQAGIARLLHNIGCYYYELKQYQQANEHIREALEIRQKINSKLGIASSIMMIGKVHYALKQYPQAIDHLNNALEQFVTIKYAEKIKGTTQVLSLAYRAQGDYKKAYETLRICQETSDSLLNQAKLRKVAQLEYEYKFAKQKDSLWVVQKRAEIRQEAKGKTTRLWVLFLLASVLGALVAIWLLMSRQKIRTRQTAQALELKETQQLLLEEQLLRKEVEEQVMQEQLQMDQAIQESFQSSMETKDHELTKQALHLVQKKQLLDEIIIDLKDVIKISRGIAQDKLKAVVKNIKREASATESWQHFTQTFEMAHPGFYQRLQQRFPELTENDLKLCALLRLGFDTKELAAILSITFESVKKARVRLRKKLELSDEVLTEFMREV